MSIMSERYMASIFKEYGVHEYGLLNIEYEYIEYEYEDGLGVAAAAHHFPTICVAHEPGAGGGAGGHLTGGDGGGGLNVWLPPEVAPPCRTGVQLARFKKQLPL